VEEHRSEGSNSRPNKRPNSVHVGRQGFASASISAQIVAKHDVHTAERRGSGSSDCFGLIRLDGIHSRYVDDLGGNTARGFRKWTIVQKCFLFPSSLEVY
jgi:hypothetical protein